MYCIMGSLIVSCSQKDNRNAVVLETDSSTENIKRDSIFKEAKSDYMNDNLKYYHYGIASCPPKLTKYLEDEFNIQVVNNIEVLSIDYTLYNEYTDSILFEKTGKKFKDFYREF